MDQPGKIEVQKRDGSIEEFRLAKLAGALWRGVRVAEGTYRDARELAGAIHIFLMRKRIKSISSSAIFEMGLKALRRIHMGEAAEILELHRTLRAMRRKLLHICHDDGNITLWDKGWLVALAMQMWHLSRQTARLLAGEVELELLPQEDNEIPRQEVLDELNKLVQQYGLADAVPVRQYMPEA